MPPFWRIFSHPASGREMDPEIADPYPLLGFGRRADVAGGGWGAVSRDRPEIEGGFSSIRGVLFLGPNRGSGCLHSGTFFSRPDSGVVMTPKISDP